MLFPQPNSFLMSQSIEEKHSETSRRWNGEKKIVNKRTGKDKKAARIEQTRMGFRADPTIVSLVQRVKKIFFPL